MIAGPGAGTFGVFPSGAQSLSWPCGRRSIVLKRMREAGFIDDAQLEQAEASPLGYEAGQSRSTSPTLPPGTLRKAGWSRSCPRCSPKEQLEVGVVSPVPPRAECGLAGGSPETDRRLRQRRRGRGRWWRWRPAEAWCGRWWAARTGRRPSSTAPPRRCARPGPLSSLFVDLTALKKGMKPEDMVVDSARCFGKYCPRNFGNRYMGQGEPGHGPEELPRHRGGGAVPGRSATTSDRHRQSLGVHGDLVSLSCRWRWGRRAAVMDGLTGRL